MSSVAESERKLGRYHLVDPIGGGPTGEAYRAKVYGVAGFERQFVVKRFHPEFVKSPEASAAVARAARTYGNLEHPRIARMQEFGVAGGETFAATEYVEGIDVTRLISSTYGAGSPLGQAAALTIAMQAARAIGYAHGRGICHYGVCPTNILCQPDGDVRVTDFGFLPPRLPKRPADDFTLLARLPYLAPEQLVHEETSPATDVFSLGVVLYELLTGDRPFKGPTPLDIAQSILSSAPEDPNIGKPVVKLLHRALARSPFERLPDASALADGLEAALRATPGAGGTREIATVVRASVEQMKKVGSQQISGAFAFPLPAPPPSKSPLARALQRGATPPPSPEAVNVQDRRTVLGVVAVKPPPDVQSLSSRRKQASVPPPIPSVPNRPLKGASDSLSALPDRAPSPSSPSLVVVDEDAPTKVRQDGSSSSAMLSEVTPLPAPAPQDPALDFALEDPPLENARTAQFDAAQPLAELDDSPVGMALVAEPTGLDITAAPAAQGRKRSNTPPKWMVAVLAVVLLGGGGFVAYSQFLGEDESAAIPPRAAKKPPAKKPPKKVAAKDPPAVPVAVPADAGAVAVGASDAAVVPVAAAVADAAVVAVVPVSPPDAAPAVVPVAPPPVVEGKLIVTSTPRRAAVYLDGAKVGTTPYETDATPDNHKLALILPGYKLYTADIDGSGAHAAQLEEVTPADGPAGIKVRCKKKNRYYVILNGADTGQLCPTERLGVPMGEHTVEIYDPVTDTRSTFNAHVKETRLSLRVRVD